jgi:hypothetical protein
MTPQHSNPLLTHVSPGVTHIHRDTLKPHKNTHKVRASLNVSCRRNLHYS